MSNATERVRLEPMFKRILVEIEDKNPYRKTITKGGILIPEPNHIHSLINREDEGIIEGGEERVVYGVVVEIASDCVSGIQVGDEVIVDKFQGMPIAMGIETLRVMPETGVI